MKNIIVVEELQSKEKNAEEFVDLLKFHLPDTVKFPGCISLETVQDEEDPTKIRLIMEWASKEDLFKYKDWRKEEGTLRKEMTINWVTISKKIDIVN